MKVYREVSNSSVISSYEYDDETLVLEVEFKTGVTYRYFDVDNATFTRLQSADSVGNFVSTEIKKFKFEKVEGMSINKPRPWRFLKSEDLKEQKPWPFPTTKPPAGAPAPASIPDEDYNSVLEWTHEEEEAFLRLNADKDGDL
jgi:hypothetical protein